MSDRLLSLKNRPEYPDNEFKFLVSSSTFRVGQQLETSNSKLETRKRDMPHAPRCWKRIMDTTDKLCKPSGELTIFEATEFKESLITLLASEGLVCLDLSQVTRVDTAGIQLMWAARRLGRLLVTGISEELQAKLTRLGFSEPLSE